MKKKLSIMAVLFITASMGNLYSMTLFYSMESDKGEQRWTQWEIFNSSETVVMIQKDPDGTRRFYCDPDGSVREMTFVNPSNQLLFQGRMQNDGLVVSVANQRTRELSTKGKYWYQPIGPSLFDFILSEEKERDFFIINPDNLKPVSFKISKIKNEFIDIDGIEREAVKAELRLSGILAPFWSGNYWFCSETGILLKYMGDSGPGTPYMTMELVSSFEKIALIRGDNL